MLCQDRLSCRQEGNKTAATLVDGIGNTDLNAVSGEKIAGAITKFLICNFDDIMKAPADIISTALMKEIYEIMETMMTDYHINAKECASTFMCICIDDSTKRYCVIHLGDGIIMCKKSEWSILSRPQNGRQGNETYLTVSKNVQRQIRVYRRKTDEIQGFMLCTDGVYCGCLNEFKERVNSGDLCFSKEREDDQSMITLKKEEENE